MPRNLNQEIWLWHWPQAVYSLIYLWKGGCLGRNLHKCMKNMDFSIRNPFMCCFVFWWFLTVWISMNTVPLGLAIITLVGHLSLRIHWILKMLKDWKILRALIHLLARRNVTASDFMSLRSLVKAKTNSLLPPVLSSQLPTDWPLDRGFLKTTNSKSPTSKRQDTLLTLPPWKGLPWQQNTRFKASTTHSQSQLCCIKGRSTADSFQVVPCDPWYETVKGNLSCTHLAYIVECSFPTRQQEKMKV